MITSIEFIVLGISSPYAQHFRMITRSQTRQPTEDAYDDRPVNSPQPARGEYSNSRRLLS